MLTVRRKRIIILCQIHTCDPCEDQRKSVGVSVKVEGTPCQRELGTLGWRRSEKGEKQVAFASLGGREMEPSSGTRNLAVLGTRR